MNVEIGAEAAQFPEKEYINGIAFEVYLDTVADMAELTLEWGGKVVREYEGEGEGVLTGL